MENFKTDNENSSSGKFAQTSSAEEIWWQKAPSVTNTNMIRRRFILQVEYKVRLIQNLNGLIFI